MLAGAIHSLRALIDEVAWTPAGNLHCTLAFLGAVEADRIPSVCRAVGSSVGGLADLPTHVDGLGAFPAASRARVLWAALADTGGALATLAAAVRHALAGVGVAREERRFRPHVTLGRIRRPRAVEIELPVEPVGFTIDRVTLFESTLGRPHAVHTPVATFPFRSDRSQPRPT